MENGSTGASKTGARPLVASSFLYIRDRERGEGQLYQETLNLVSSTGHDMLKGKLVDWMNLVTGL